MMACPPESRGILVPEFSMILCAIPDFRCHVPLHPRFPALADFLERLDLAALPEGRTDLDGDDIFVVASPKARTKPQAEAALEAHRKYIDVQVVLSGIDTMGWSPLSICTEVAVPFNAECDIEFFANPPASLVPVPAGCLTIFFPEDAHAPLIGSCDSVYKLVFKVRA
jgi:YhcH/YjgK/YiaL family protein